ncbi:ABC transporter permease subunit [Pseudobacillus sp. 179-B 2D1 NHS]|uniref:ABC transporter permease subunit n=1 Tax=Pseudobacillus sp. 179-B 2D1 NHS TaxID=3374292 RepID=UPI00387A6250
MFKYFLTITLFFLLVHFILSNTEQTFFSALITSIYEIQSPFSITYRNHGSNADRLLLPELLSLFVYSFFIFFLSFCIALLTTFLLLNFYYCVSNSKKKVARNLLTAVESIPDIMIFLIIQLSVIYFYKLTGVTLFSIADSGNGRPYILPVICLAIIPTIQLTKMSINYLHEESKKTYIEFAYAKGIGKNAIFYKHLFRNIVPLLFYHSKPVFLFMLSSMFVIEYMFNLNGYMSFLFRGRITPTILFIWFSVLFTPSFLYFYTMSIFLRRRGVNP